MVEFLFRNSNIRLADDHIELITALITGNSSVWKKHLTPKLNFLTEIVNNKYCHIDVDKCDYLLRDAWYLKHQIHIKDFIEFLEGAKVVYVVDKSGKYRSHIGYRSEDFQLIENLFENRKMLHMEIYQHHDVIGCEKM